MDVSSCLSLNTFPSLYPLSPSPPPPSSLSLSLKKCDCSCSSCTSSSSRLARRRSAVLVPSVGVASLLFAHFNFFTARPASAQVDELQQDENRLVDIFQVPLS